MACYLGGNDDDGPLIPPDHESPRTPPDAFTIPWLESSASYTPTSLFQESPHGGAPMPPSDAGSLLAPASSSPTGDLSPVVVLPAPGPAKQQRQQGSSGKRKRKQSDAQHKKRATASMGKLPRWTKAEVGTETSKQPWATVTKNSIAFTNIHHPMSFALLPRWFPFTASQHNPPLLPAPRYHCIPCAVPG
eukprot:m.203275 g.203275  ORF g.203275 m.203275 type:complete len:190 (-) comp18452_c0_seq4:87-656(-)